MRALRHDLLGCPVDPLPPLRRPRVLRWLPHTAIALVAFAELFAATPDLDRAYGLATPVAFLLACGQAMALLLALRQPMAGWWVSLVTFAVTAQTVALPYGAAPWPWTTGGILGHALVQVLVAQSVRPRVAVETVAATTLVTLLPVWPVLWGPTPPYTSSTAAALTAFALVTTLSGLLRGRNRARRQLAAQETLTTEERARRALLEERGRIARELHDVVAHHMAVISIQAEAGPYRVPDPPPELVRSFAVIRENAVEALTELRRVLDVLRSETPVEDEEDDAPQPTLDRMDDLLTNVRTAGMDVTLDVTGGPRTLSSGVGLSGYRIVQEALSNALRHAPGARVRVGVAYGGKDVRLTVVNGPTARPPAPRTAPGAGHGLVGMRERALMLGGSLAAGPRADGGYEVSAVLPRRSRPEGECP